MCRFINITINIIVAFLLTDCIIHHCAVISVAVPKEMTGRQISPSTGCVIAV